MYLNQLCSRRFYLTVIMVYTENESLANIAETNDIKTCSVLIYVLVSCIRVTNTRAAQQFLTISITPYLRPI